ncbi:MAG: DNA mismatch repair protein MutS [Deltaproteobacteria bacterium]|nr:DNA mismatch repair protein MutS [Deltaproteobacteria bacterium]
MENATPAMRQYLEIKERHKDAVVFFRMGDFYEMFYEDALVGSKVMGVALTSRDKEKKIPMCGVPYHAAALYVAKLVKAGHKVAICEQTENPAEAKGVVERKVVRVVTPGTALEDEIVDAKLNNFIAAISVSGKTHGIAFMDVSTGEFRASEFESAAVLEDEIAKLTPSEIIVGDKAAVARAEDNGAGPLIIAAPDKFSKKAAIEALKEHFGVVSLEGFGFDTEGAATVAAGALLLYVKDAQKTELTHVKKLVRLRTDSALMMDAATRKSLELIENSRSTDKKGSLLSHLDRTRTSMGARTLRSWLISPLIDEAGVKARLDAVGELIEARRARVEAADTLDKTYDLERLGAKVAVRMSSPRDMVALKASLERAGELKELLSKNFSSPLIKNITGSIDAVPEAAGLIARSVRENTAATLKDGGVIADGYSAELDELRKIGGGGKEWVAGLESSERKKTGINTLKVGYNRVFGYYIEITQSAMKNACLPPEYSRKQTLANAERFVTPELKEWESKILTSEEKAKSLEAELFSDIVKTVAAYVERIQKTSEAVATLDSLISFASVSEDNNYVKPKINSGTELTIEEGRHPVIEAGIRAEFVPNDTALDTVATQIVILTGPNMAGKSTFIRQVALITILAQCGCFVPAKKATIGIVDRIFSRVGASDDISKGHSTFMVEMNETANILNNATPRSLVILDEIGRGTATFDGLSIAWAVAEHLHDSVSLGCKTLFATHYHELTELSLTKERVKNYNMAIKEWGDKITFLRRVVPGGASKSYGIQVAKLAGLPKEVIARAKEILRNIENGELNSSGSPRIAGKDDARQGNLPLSYKKTDALKERLKAVDADLITPIEALNILNELKDLAGD